MRKLKLASWLASGLISLAAVLPAISGQHKVVSGENLSVISEQKGVPIANIVQINSLKSADEIYAGQVLKIPEIHKVAKGDNLSSIAQKYNIPISDILDLNKISDPNKIVIGQVIYIPDYKSCPINNNFPKKSDKRHPKNHRQTKEYDYYIDAGLEELLVKKPEWLTKNLVKSILIQESYGSTAWNYDPMQLADVKMRDRSNSALISMQTESENTSLIMDCSFLNGAKFPSEVSAKAYEESRITPEKSIKGGIAWLVHKAAVYEYDDKGNIIVKKFRNRKEALRRYNGSRANESYANEVIRIEESLK